MAADRGLACRRPWPGTGCRPTGTRMPAPCAHPLLLLPLLPAAKVNLMAGAKRTTNRDFRIRLDAAAGGEGNSGRAGQQQRGRAKEEEQGEEGEGQGGWLLGRGSVVLLPERFGLCVLLPAMA